MESGRIGDDAKLAVAGISSVLVVSVLSYIGNTPLKFVLALAGITACIYSARKLKNQFGIPTKLIMRDEPNYWGAAFGGLVGAVSALYGSTRDFEQVSFAELGMELSLIVIYLVLGCILYMGTILQDIEDGYLEISGQDS